jgi:hypothetical protein
VVGLRLVDPSTRNAVRADLATHRRSLDPHLAYLHCAKKVEEAGAEVSKQGKELGKYLLLKGT